MTARHAGIALALLSALACRGRVERPDVLMITLDTTRWDRLGFAGYPRGTSPSLDALAARSVVFTRAVAASSWTLPSHASMFTGKFPASHGARYDPEGSLRLTDAIPGPAVFREYRARALSAGEITLAAILRDGGYRTGAVVGGPWMKKVFGLDRGFDHYDDRSIGDVGGRLAGEVTTAALELLAVEDPRPLFLFLNYFDPHGPYEAPAPFGGSIGDETSDRYDEEIRYMDHHIGRLLEGMERLGLFEDSLILVTADHGELLGEHGRMGHGATLYEEEIRVPLLVKYPRGEVPPERRDEPAHHVDLLPLVLDRLGLPIPPGVQGEIPSRGRRPLLAEVDPLSFISDEGAWRALYLGRHKLLWNSRGHHRLYDVASDPGERVDLSDAQAQRTREALTILEKVLASLPAPGEEGPPAELDPETLDALRGLGYVP